jgi:hypothetical protein
MHFNPAAKRHTGGDALPNSNAINNANSDTAANTKSNCDTNAKSNNDTFAWPGPGVEYLDAAAD